MFCKYCGKQLKDNEICTCPEAQAEAAAGTSQAQPRPSAGTTPPKAPKVSLGGAAAAAPSGFVKKLLPLVIIIAVLAVLASVVILNRKTTIDMKDYVQVSFQGMNTVGTADVDVDWMSLDNKALADSGNFLGDSVLLEAAMKVDATPTEGLSNGDTVTVSVSCDESTAERLKLKFVNTSVDYTVSGLPDGVETDVFADLSVTFDGIAPGGTVSLKNNSTDDFVKGVSFSADPSNGLSNGDTVTVTAHYNEQNAVDQLRVVPETTKTYTVSGLDAYVSSYDQLDQDTIDQLTQQSKDTIDTDLLAARYSYTIAAYGSFQYEVEEESIVFTDVSLQTTYFAAAKPDAYTTRNNELVQVFKITATDSKSPDGITFYYSVGYRDFILKGDGTISVKMTDTIDRYGDPTTDAIYNKVIAPLAADYTVTQA